MELERGSLKTGLFMAVSLSVAAIIVLLFITMDGNTWKAVSRIKPGILAAALALLVVKWSAHIARTKLLVRASGERLSVGRTTKTILAGSFTGSVTPFKAAAIPVEIFFLYVYGLPAARATAVIATGSTMSVLLFALAMPVILLTTAARVNLHVGFRSLLVVAGIVAFLLLLVAVFSMRNPSRAASIVTSKSPGFLTKRKWFERDVERFFGAVGEFSKSLRTILGYSKVALSEAAALTVVIWTSVVFIPALILWSLGRPDLFWQAVLAQLVVAYLLPFIPVPGESGVAEATFAGVYAVFVPANLIGVVTLAWRFITFYVALAVSGVAFVIASRDASRLGIRRLPEGENAEKVSQRLKKRC